MTFPPCSLALGMRERYAMQCAKVFENLFTSNQSKGEVTVGLEVSLENGLLQKGLDGIEARMAPVPTRILQWPEVLILQGKRPLSISKCPALDSYSDL